MKKLRCLAHHGVLPVLGTITLLFTACTSANNPPAPNADAKIVTKDYKYVNVTGSLIPVRVPNDTNVRPLLNANPVTNISPDDFEKWVSRAQSQGH